VGAPSDEKLLSFTLPFAEIAPRLTGEVPNVKQEREQQEREPEESEP
jgi:hypothetical protein